MHENFIALEQEKRDRIINAAMREFAVKGYAKASTNEIVKNAGISKGALFHYFASKQELFEFLYSYSIDTFTRQVRPRINNLPADVFERWVAFAALKIEIAAQHPDMADFIYKIYVEDAENTIRLQRSELLRFSEAISQSIYEGIDYEKFRPEVDVPKALKIIWWVLEGFALAKQKERPLLSDVMTGEYVRLLTAEIETYLSLLKNAFYKPQAAE